LFFAPTLSYYFCLSYLLLTRDAAMYMATDPMV
jgi:hypothetical protein